MNENTLIKLKSQFLKRRREMLEQVAHLEFEREELGRLKLPDEKGLLNMKEA